MSSTLSFSNIFFLEVVCLLFATFALKRRMNSSSSLRFSSAFAFWFCACLLEFSLESLESPLDVLTIFKRYNNHV